MGGGSGLDELVDEPGFLPKLHIATGFTFRFQSGHLFVGSLDKCLLRTSTARALWSAPGMLRCAKHAGSIQCSDSSVSPIKEFVYREVGSHQRGREEKGHIGREAHCVQSKFKALRKI